MSNPLSSEILACFSLELMDMEKQAIFNLVGRGAAAAGRGMLRGAGAVGKAAVKHPLAATGVVGTGALGTYLTAKGLKGAREGYAAHSYGALPQTKTPTF